MGPLDFALHLLSFALPALAVAIVVAFGSRWVLRAKAPVRRWWLPVVTNFAAGFAALAAGLWYFGHDGKMATYAALVLAVATAQWLVNRAWR